MSSYYIDCFCDSLKIGPFESLGEAQTKAQQLADEYVATDPTILNLQKVSNLYVVVKNSITTYTSEGVVFNNSNEFIDKKWEIIELTSP